MVFLQLGTFSQTCSQVQAMNNELPQISLKDNPQLAIAMLTRQSQELMPMQQKLASCVSAEQKLQILSQLPVVADFFTENQELENALSDLSVQHQYAVKVAVALNQGPVLFADWQNCEDVTSAINKLADTLYATERFYEYMGGIAGYHVKTLQLISDQLAKKAVPDVAKLLLPPTTDIREQSPSRDKMVKDGICSLDQMAELYVVGGAGDRLALVDEQTNMPLPVAKLGFAGHTLLENLIRDLEAREYLSYRLNGIQNFTPVVLMTSHEKQNDAQIAAILEERAYFGRPKQTIFRLLQPMTPVIAIDGKWAVSGPLKPILKPGGHGVVWKLAEEFGAFDWLEKQKRCYLVVRQINNPLAGLDANLLCLAGFGHANKKGFGFESVPRLPNMSEGMNVLKEVATGANVSCSITNIEYTEFAKASLNDPQFARIADSPDFPANTNILFANIAHVRDGLKRVPVPGFLVNMKHPVETLREGQKVELLAARLESTMQNMADTITNPHKEFSKLDTFVLLNDRAKTMSVTKKAYDGKSAAETPEGCFYDLTRENLNLLRKHCSFDVASLNELDDYMQHGPNALFLYHPALGPLYSIIGQKITKGKLCAGAELQIEASEVALSNLIVDGSLHIVAEQITGGNNEKTGQREFSNHPGRCVLSNVLIKNKGINRSAKNSYFKSRIERNECATIHLLGNSELIAKNVVFDGNQSIVVQPGTRAIVSQGPEGDLIVEVQDVSLPHPDSLAWSYTLDSDNSIKLQRL